MSARDLFVLLVRAAGVILGLWLLEQLILLMTMMPMSPVGSYGGLAVSVLAYVLVTLLLLRHAHWIADKFTWVDLDEVFGPGTTRPPIDAKALLLQAAGFASLLLCVPHLSRWIPRASERWFDAVPVGLFGGIAAACFWLARRRSGATPP